MNRARAALGPAELRLSKTGQSERALLPLAAPRLGVEASLASAVDEGIHLYEIPQSFRRRPCEMPPHEIQILRLVRKLRKIATPTLERHAFECTTSNVRATPTVPQIVVPTSRNATERRGIRWYDGSRLQTSKCLFFGQTSRSRPFLVEGSIPARPAPKDS